MGTSKRVDTPLITISAMVRVGPWTVENVLHGHWRKCDRCGTDHKEVWVCTIDSDVDNTTVQARLDGQRTWRVGSTCGPTLEMVSEANWAGETKDLQRVVRLAVDATRALERAQALGMDHLFRPHIVENLEFLKRGHLDRRMQRGLRHHVTWLSSSIRHAEEEKAKAAAQSSGSARDPCATALRE